MGAAAHALQSMPGMAGLCQAQAPGGVGIQQEHGTRRRQHRFRLGTAPEGQGNFLLLKPGAAQSGQLPLQGEHGAAPADAGQAQLVPGTQPAAHRPLPRGGFLPAGQQEAAGTARLRAPGHDEQVGMPAAAEGRIDAAFPAGFLQTALDIGQDLFAAAFRDTDTEHSITPA